MESTNKCSKPECNNKVKATGLCAAHYRRVQMSGPVSKSVATHYYRYDLLDWRRRVLDLPVAHLALQLKVRERTVQDVCEGRASAKQAYPVAKALGLDWAQVHNFELQEIDFYSAVTNGTGHAKANDEKSLSLFRWLKRRFWE